MSEKPKRAYFCSISWDHEMGECEVTAYSNPKQCNHTGCGIIEAKLIYVRTVKKENMVGVSFIPIKQIRHEQLKSIKAKIKRLQEFYKRVLTEKI